MDIKYINRHQQAKQVRFFVDNLDVNLDENMVTKIKSLIEETSKVKLLLEDYKNNNRSDFLNAAIKKQGEVIEEQKWIITKLLSELNIL